MKLRYHIATISFCPDLLDPEGVPSVPMGVLLLGESTGRSVALLVVNREPTLPESLHGVIREIIQQFPAILQSQLESILHSDAGRSIDTIMQVFEDSLRNSFFVSDLRMNQFVEVARPVVPVSEENMLYQPSADAAAASIAAHFDRLRAIDYHYTPWATAGRGLGDHHVQ